MRIYDLAVIGAGPAGTMAAITAARDGATVVLIEKNPMIGRKLFSTGNGRCNICNADTSLEHFHGAKPEFTGTVLKQFDQTATVEFFEKLGLLLKEESRGRMFPRTNQASSVVEVLKQELNRCKVETLLSSPVRTLHYGMCWQIATADTTTVSSRNLIITTGGRAAHQLGSTGDGLGWAYRLGHTITPTYPALVPLETAETWPKALQGLKIDASSCFVDRSGVIHRGAGDLHFNNYGISGPAAMSLARCIAPEVKDNPVQIHIDVLPDVAEDKLRYIMLMRKADSIANILIGLLPDRLIPVVLDIAGISADERPGSWQVPKLNDFVSGLKDITMTVSKLRPFKEAQVTAGGIDTDQIDPNSMRSRLVDHLYFAGEIVDVDGDSGGYNLQWAWSSGHVAGLLR